MKALFLLDVAEGPNCVRCAQWGGLKQSEPFCAVDGQILEYEKDSILCIKSKACLEAIRTKALFDCSEFLKKGSVTYIRCSGDDWDACKECARYENWRNDNGN